MQRVILMILLSVVSSSAIAGWVKVITDTNYDKQSPCDKNCYFIYVDIATISKTGDTVKVWRMNDFDKAQASYSRYKPSVDDKLHLSVKIQEEYNCKEQKVRLLSVSWHSGRMGGGQTVHIESDAGRWASIGGLSPDVPVKLLWRAVCEKQ